jgi:putative membrane protein
MDIMRNRTHLTTPMLVAGLIIAASAVGLLIAASAAAAQTAPSPAISSAASSSPNNSSAMIASAASSSPTTSPAASAAPSDTSTTAPSTSAGNPVQATSGSAKLKATDKTFVRKAAEGGLAEVELGKLAASKASDPEVKSFGQKMVDDHSKANDRLKQTVGTKGVDLPSDMSAKDKALEARLDKLSGADFDRAYMKEMLKDHQKDVAEFRREAKRAGADPDVKSFASETLPTLEEHLKMAQDVSKKVGVSGSGATRSHASRSSRRSSAAGTSPGH